MNSSGTHSAVSTQDAGGTLGCLHHALCTSSATSRLTVLVRVKLVQDNNGRLWLIHCT
jgi:hypothetical protein